MKRFLVSIGAILLSLAFITPVVLAASTSYAFNLQGPNVSTAANRVIISCQEVKNGNA